MFLKLSGFSEIVRVTQFFLSDSGLSLPQTERILNARGVNGIILSPILHSPKLELSLNWEQFATVVIGRGQVGPPLHRVLNSVVTNAIPEPSFSLILGALGVAGLLRRSRKRPAGSLK